MQLLDPTHREPTAEETTLLTDWLKTHCVPSMPSLTNSPEAFDYAWWYYMDAYSVETEPGESEDALTLAETLAVWVDICDVDP